MLSKRKILVVDDNAGNRLLLKYGLEGYFDIDFASSGYSAINKFIDTKYDLVLMDVYMPELDGIETTLQLRRMENGHRTPIFAMTSGLFREQKVKCIEAGMDDYLIKPIHAKLLVERINQYLTSSMTY